MFRTIQIAAVALTTMIAATSALAQQLTDVNPLFRPSGSIIKKNTGRYYVWYEGSTWHIRTTAPKDKARTFSGAIQVHGAGRVESLRQIGKDGGDRSQINLARTQVNWQFYTGRYSDGIDVKVTARDGATVSIVLREGDKNISLENVHIGAKQVRPKRLPLLFPAKPNRSMYRIDAKAPENPYLVYHCEAEDLYRENERFYLKDASDGQRHGHVIDAKIGKGKTGNGLHFFGPVSRVRTPAKQHRCRTLAMWVNCRDWTRSFQLISGNTSDFRGMAFQLVNKGQGSLAVGNGKKWIFSKSFDLGVKPNEWQHFTLVTAAPGGKFACYIDGVKIHEDIMPQDGKIDDDHHWVISTPWGEHAIEGAVDEVMIYERALTDKEIQALYLAGVKATGSKPD